MAWAEIEIVNFWRGFIHIEEKLFKMVEKK